MTHIETEQALTAALAEMERAANELADAQRAGNFMRTIEARASYANAEWAYTDALRRQALSNA